jgi:hypothetical protein
MRFIQFIKWCWDQNDWFNRTVGIIIVQGLCFLFSCIFIGGIGVVLAITTALFILVLWGLYGIFCWLRHLWKQFDDAVPTEDVAVIRKLKGIPTPSTVNQGEDCDDFLT